MKTFDELLARISSLEADVEFLFAFVPPWAKEVPDGLNPMFYGTGSADGDRQVAAQVAEVAARHGLKR